MARLDVGGAIAILMNLLRGGASSTDRGGWGDPTNEAILPRDISWTVREASNYGGEHQEPVGMAEENRKASERMMGDLASLGGADATPDPSEPAPRRDARA